MSDSENKDSDVPTEVENEKTEPKVDKEETENGVAATEDKKPESGGAGEPVATMETDGQGSSKEEEEEEEKEVKKETPKKKKEKKEAKEDDEDESEEEWEEPPPGLLERPVLMKGKRERKTVERIDVSIKTTPKEEFKVPEGKGEKFGDIPRIEFKLGRTLADDLKPVHRILYGKVGATTVVKKHIRQFNGFDFEKDSPEYKKKTHMLNGFTLTLLKYVCDIIDVEKGGTKENIVTRIMDLLMKPKSSGKKVPEKRKKKSADKKDKKKRKTKSKKPASKKESPKKAKKSKEEVEESESEDEEESEDESDDSSSEEEEEVKPPPKKKAKKEEPKKAPAKKTPAKKKPPTPKKAAESDSLSSDDSDDDEPLAAKKEEKKPPTDSELKSIVKKVLEGANLEQVTMKSVCRMVYDKFPGMDLTHRKDFIKGTVKELIR